MELSQILRFSEGLIDWYWKFGIMRSGDYSLSLIDWLNRLYASSNWLKSAQQAFVEKKPAMAIWGPSQTGKSTSISAYIDGNSPLTMNLSTEGSGTGLHWPGGLPFRFMAPIVDDLDKIPNHISRRVLNPFNKGADGSSCLTRFTAGSLTPMENRYHVRFPEFPVTLQTVTIKDLWHSIARGYGSECSGPKGRQTRWNLPRFQQELERFRKQFAATLPRLKEGELGVDRLAFERLRDFVEVLEDLASIEEKDSNYYELSESKEEWRSTLRNLMQEPTLYRSLELLEIFVSRILWDGLDSITELYKNLAETRESLFGNEGPWRDKPVYCSLETAAIFLNMSAPAIAMNPSRPNPESSEGHIFDLIQNLQWEERDGVILVGCDPEMQGNGLGNDPMFFSNLQSLVWELTIPVNLDNLEDHPFAGSDRSNALKDFLSTADLLDFAGVGNDRPADRVKLIADQAYAQQLKAEGNPPPEQSLMNPVNFFSKVLKRGKTASIVATYAKRMNIDGFSVFQGVRGQPCPNAGQLIQGIEFWWRYNLPDYYRNPRGKCPSPLNLVLTWWSEQLNYATDELDQRMFDGVKRIVESLGILRDPEVSTSFAIHYHNSPDKAARIVYDFSPGSTRYRTLWSIKDFKNQFQEPLSKTSFEEMITDKETGGAEFFFNTARDQMMQTREPGRENRLVHIEKKSHDVLSELHQLLKEPNLFPLATPKDTRKEHLIEARKSIYDHLESLPGERIKTFNFHFRELFNIRPDILDYPPLHSSLITDLFLGKQYRYWIHDRVSNFDPTNIGFDDAYSLKLFMSALVDSVKPDFPIAVERMRRFASRPQMFEESNPVDLRPHLAVVLSNILLRGVQRNPAPVKQSVSTRKREFSQEKRYYSMFLEPLIGKGQRLDKLIERQIIPVKRPAQPGDTELVELTESYSLKFQ